MEQYVQDEEMLDYRTGLICSILAEVNRDRKKRAQPFKPTDFMPERRAKEAPKRLTPKQTAEQMKTLTKIMGGEIR